MPHAGQEKTPLRRLEYLTSILGAYARAGVGQVSAFNEGSGRFHGNAKKVGNFCIGQKFFPKLRSR
jgi:hypothetical protein